MTKQVQFISKNEFPQKNYNEICHLYVGIVMIFKHAGEIKLKLNQYWLPPSLVNTTHASVQGMHQMFFWSHGKTLKFPKLLRPNLNCFGQAKKTLAYLFRLSNVIFSTCWKSALSCSALKEQGQLHSNLGPKGWFSPWLVRKMWVWTSGWI